MAYGLKACSCHPLIWKKLEKEIKLPAFFKDNDGNEITDSIDIADYFNDFFPNIGTWLAEKLQILTMNTSPQ